MMRSARYRLPSVTMWMELRNVRTQLTNSVAGRACSPSSFVTVSFLVTRLTFWLRDWGMLCFSDRWECPHFAEFYKCAVAGLEGQFCLARTRQFRFEKLPPLFQG